MERGTIGNSDNRPTAIEVVNLSKRYKNGVLANNNISLQIARGELLSLLGPNGAGKTTLVRQITGELERTTGEIRVFNIDVVRQPKEARRLLGVVPQEAGIFWHLNVKEHLLYFGRIRGLKRKELKSRVDSLIQELNLGEHLYKWGNELSGGIKRKLLVGLSLVGNPSAIVLDEPTTGLDPHSRREVWELIRRYQREGAAVLLTTHYMEEAEYLSERVGIISRGEVKALGTINELHEHSDKRYKLTYNPPDSPVYPREWTTIYGRTIEELQKHIQSIGLEEYDIAKTNLEDIYLELTSQSLKAEGNSEELV